MKENKSMGAMDYWFLSAFSLFQDRLISVVTLQLHFSRIDPHPFIRKSAPLLPLLLAPQSLRKH